MMPNHHLLARISDLSMDWRNGVLGDAEYASLYFIYWQIALHGRSFASRRYKTGVKPDPSEWLSELGTVNSTPLADWLLPRLESCQFKGIIPNVPAALVAWLCGAWPLTLLERIPSPREVLNCQVAGTRPVTLMACYPRLLEPVLGKANGLDFMVHDLEHAYKFFQDESLHQLQRNFFALLSRAEQEGILNPYPEDSIFAAQIDYLISDMNTHPVHGLRFVAASLVECLLRHEGQSPEGTLSPKAEQELLGYLRRLAGCWDFSSEAEAAVLMLATRSFGAAEAGVIEAEIICKGHHIHRPI